MNKEVGDGWFIDNQERLRVLEECIRHRESLIIINKNQHDDVVQTG